MKDRRIMDMLPRQTGRRGRKEREGKTKNGQWTGWTLDSQEGQGIRVHLLSTQTGDSAGKIDRGEEGLDT